DDCSLALRGLQTLAVRLDQLERSTLIVASWLAEQENIDTVLHPALPSCPGHTHWQRDFKGSASLFSVLFKDNASARQVINFLEALNLFKVGLSWGGVTSLAVVYPALDRPSQNYGERLVRFNIGLEDPDDLISDLKNALTTSFG
ncbi:MAG: PLP-dependent transferase, partial [Paracoccaceae bacterium]|nr:PLP-dependent transferase [Paracoccaceae bacterium]